MTSTTLSFESALLPDGFAHDVVLDINVDGTIERITKESGRNGSGCALPGIANLHSHAHQRAMAGLAERSGSTADSFWTWRKTMYSFLQAMTPEQLHAVAAQLYVEMLKAGYTRVAEFQYLHHQPNGKPYEQRAEMSLHTLQAALDTGIGLTSLPVHYQFGGFGKQPVGSEQRRFFNEPEDFVDLFSSVAKHSNDHANVNTGIAAHSLRAVDAATFSEVATHCSRHGDIPIHIHISEQLKEVADCIAWCGSRPVSHLFEHARVDRNWCLIHATHMSEDETRLVARSNAVAGLCPTTEANLGDGLFNAVGFAEANGVFGIGSDSHISVSPVEELRWLEYGQRLLNQTRNELSGGYNRSTGRNLLELCAAGGAQACGHNAGELKVGRRADFVVLNTEHPLLCEREGDALVDSWIFSGNQNVVNDVYVGGDRVIHNGRHAHEDRIAENFKSTLKQLRAKL